MVEPTHLKNISQNGNLPQIGVKIKNIWNHHLDSRWFIYPCFSDISKSFFRQNALPCLFFKRKNPMKTASGRWREVTDVYPLPSTLEGQDLSIGARGQPWEPKVRLWFGAFVIFWREKMDQTTNNSIKNPSTRMVLLEISWNNLRYWNKKGLETTCLFDCFWWFCIFCLKHSIWIKSNLENTGKTLKPCTIIW